MTSPIPTEPGVPLPCSRYPECAKDADNECNWPDCVQDGARRLSVEDVFRAVVDSIAAEDYDVQAGWQRFRAWLIEQGHHDLVPDDERDIETDKMSPTICPEGHGAMRLVPNRAQRRRQKHHPFERVAPPWAVDDWNDANRPVKYTVR